MLTFTLFLVTGLMVLMAVFYVKAERDNIELRVDKAGLECELECTKEAVERAKEDKEFWMAESQRQSANYYELLEACCPPETFEWYINLVSKLEDLFELSEDELDKRYEELRVKKLEHLRAIWEIEDDIIAIKETRIRRKEGVGY